MHREMRGEKSIEVRIEDVRTLEPSLELSTQVENRAQGMVQIQIKRATPRQLLHLKHLIEEHPGSYEVSIHVTTAELTPPIEITQHVEPTTEFMKRIKEKVATAMVDVQDWAGEINPN